MINPAWTERVPNLIGLVDPQLVAGEINSGLDLNNDALNRRLSAASETLPCRMNVKVNGSFNLYPDTTKSETITAQSPKAGKVPCNSTINITAS